MRLWKKCWYLGLDKIKKRAWTSLFIQTHGSQIKGFRLWLASFLKIGDRKCGGKQLHADMADKPYHLLWRGGKQMIIIDKHFMLNLVIYLRNNLESWGSLSCLFAFGNQHNTTFMEDSFPPGTLYGTTTSRSMDFSKPPFLRKNVDRNSSTELLLNRCRKSHLFSFVEVVCLLPFCFFFSQKFSLQVFLCILFLIRWKVESCIRLPRRIVAQRLPSFLSRNHKATSVFDRCFLVKL